MLGQRIQKQIGQTGIPVYNVANACATGASALRTVDHARSRPARPTWVSRSASSRWARWACSAARRADAARSTSTSANGRYGAVMGTEGILGTNLMPGVFAQAGMEYAYKHDGVGFEQFAKVAEKNHWHSQHNPLAQYQKVFSLEEVMGAEMISLPEHAPHVLPDRRRRGGRGRRVRLEAEDALATSSRSAR